MRFIKEISVLIVQLLMFYIFPLFAGPTDAIGMVVLILLSTFILSNIIGAVSKEKLKYLYPLITAVIFIPSVFIYYNSSALIHSFWYLAVSLVGLMIGILAGRISNRK